MGFRTILVGIMGLLTMLSTSAVGQFPAKLMSSPGPFQNNIPPGNPRAGHELLPMIENLMSGIRQALDHKPSSTPQKYLPVEQSPDLKSYSPQPKPPQYNPSNAPPAAFSPPHSSQFNAPQYFPGGLGPVSPQLNPQQYSPSSTLPGSLNSFNPLSRTPTSLYPPQQYTSLPQRGGLIPVSPQYGPQKPYPSSTLPESLNRYILPRNPTNLNPPQVYPSNPQPIGFIPHNSQTSPQQPNPYNPKPSYKPQSNIQQQYPSREPPANFNSRKPPPSNQQQYSPRSQQPGMLNSNSNPYYLAPSNQQPGTSSTESKPSYNHQNPSFSSHQPATSSTDSKPSYSNQPPSSTSQQPAGSSTGTTTDTNASPSSSGSDSTKSTSVHPTSPNSHPSKHGYSGPAPKHHPHPPSPFDGDPLKGHRIVCIFNNQHYYRDEFRPSQIESHLCTHINYEFAVLDPDNNEVTMGEPDLDIQENFYQEVCDLKKKDPKLKIILSIGGWSDSTKKYSEMAADEEKRKRFAQSCVSFIQKHKFDGMDLAWEYPNCWQGALGINPKDKEHFILLLKELKLALEGLIFSVSVSAIKREIEAAYDVPAINKLVDYINVMAYDMHGPWESVTGHHTQFEMIPGDSDPYLNTKAAMDLWHQMGADKDKLNCGIALYGRTFTLANPNEYGMGAPAKGIGEPGPDSDEGGLLLYSEICQFLDAGNWTEYEDKHAGYYAYCGDQWACYDNPMMMVKKAKYVIVEGYGGVLLKYLSGDDFKGLCFSMTFPLLKMCRFEMENRLKRNNHHTGHYK